MVTRNTEYLVKILKIYIGILLEVLQFNHDLRDCRDTENREVNRGKCKIGWLGFTALKNGEG